MGNHEYYMKKAIELAKFGWGRTNPNPLVGAVIVKDGKIISKGYHKAIGSAHAEADAIANAKEDLTGSSLYVNLEPCSHFGKTPPCTDAIIKAGIKDVIIAMTDPNPKVNGRGIVILKEAGINVTLGVLGNEARKLNEIFIKFITKNEPFVIMKSAMSLDGKIASYSGNSKWISCEESRKYVHELRGRVSAVMVGINTVIADDPHLTVRLPARECRDPIRIIIDSKGRLPLDSNVLKNMKPGGVILAATSQIDAEKEKILIDKGVIIIKADNDSENENENKNRNRNRNRNRNDIGSGSVNLNVLMDKLGESGIDSILLEGGGTINASALAAGIVDKVIMFIAPKIIGGEFALTPVEGRGFESIEDSINLHDISIKRIEDDIVYEAYL